MNEAAERGAKAIPVRKAREGQAPWTRCQHGAALPLARPGRGAQHGLGGGAACRDALAVGAHRAGAFHAALLRTCRSVHSKHPLGMGKEKKKRGTDPFEFHLLEFVTVLL